MIVGCSEANGVDQVFELLDIQIPRSVQILSFIRIVCKWTDKKLACPCLLNFLSMVLVFDEKVWIPRFLHFPRGWASCDDLLMTPSFLDTFFSGFFLAFSHTPFKQVVSVGWCLKILFAEQYNGVARYHHTRLMISSKRSFSYTGEIIQLQ